MLSGSSVVVTLFHKGFLPSILKVRSPSWRKVIVVEMRRTEKRGLVVEMGGCADKEGRKRGSFGKLARALFERGSVGREGAAGGKRGGRGSGSERDGRDGWKGSGEWGTGRNAGGGGACVQ